MASFLAYITEKRIAKDGHTFGQGNIKGVAAPEVANNAACCGSFVPLLTLDVPGSGSTVVLLGALLVMGVTPGPMMMTESPDIFWGVIASMYIGNLMLLALILLFCMIGVYGLKFSAFDLWVLLGFGLVGLMMRLNGFPVAPMILALILGGMMEENMRRALQISGGDWMVFLDKPISAGLLGVAVFSLILPPLWHRLRGHRRHA